MTVGCYVCKKPFKIDCVGVSKSDARRIHTGSGVHWFCNPCEGLGNDLLSLKTEIARLRDEIKDLKDATAASKSPQLSFVDTERIISEISDREGRKCNVLVYSCTESPNLNKNELLTSDMIAVKEMFVGMGVDEAVVGVQRLGRFDAGLPSRCRPLKVQLQSASSVTAVTKNSAKLKSSTKWAGISIGRDRTKMQRDHYNHVRGELRHRVENGEANLRIKYVNNIPTIVSSVN